MKVIDLSDGVQKLVKKEHERQKSEGIIKPCAKCADLLRAFIWGESPQGYDFWNKIYKDGKRNKRSSPSRETAQVL